MENHEILTAMQTLCNFITNPNSNNSAIKAKAEGLLDKLIDKLSAKVSE